jgi:hypothetical protein
VPVFVSNESNDVKWISIESILKDSSYDNRLVRMCEKIKKMTLQRTNAIIWLY